MKQFTAHAPSVQTTPSTTTLVMAVAAAAAVLGNCNTDATVTRTTSKFTCKRNLRLPASSSEPLPSIFGVRLTQPATIDLFGKPKSGDENSNSVKSSNAAVLFTLRGGGSGEEDYTNQQTTQPPGKEKIGLQEVSKNTTVDSDNIIKIKKSRKSKEKNDNNKKIEPQNQNGDMHDIDPTSSTTACSTEQQQQQQQQPSNTEPSLKIPESFPKETKNWNDNNAANEKQKKKSATNHRDHSNGSKNDDSQHSRKTKDNKESNRTTASEKSKPNAKHNNKSHAIVTAILQETDYYKILGLHKSNSRSSTSASDKITASAIQKAYRRRAVLTHPDKTVDGDRTAFDKVAETYDVLSDATKRSVYDKYGKKGVDEHNMYGATAGGSASNVAEELFRSFFGDTATFFPGFGTGRGQHQPEHQTRTRNRTMRYQLEVTLEDMYHGMTRDIQLQTQHNPSYHHQHHHPNNDNSKHIEVHIPKGSLDGQSIVMPGANDFYHEDVPADLIFVLKQRPHPLYTRRGYDIACSVTDVTLSEAICGLERTIIHLSGKPITVRSAHHHTQTTTESASNAEEAINKYVDDPLENSNSDETSQLPMLIESGDVQVLKGWGMPKNAQGTAFGDLYIQFHVRMPSTSTATTTTSSSSRKTSPLTSLTQQERNELKRLLMKLEDTAAATTASSSTATTVTKSEEAEKLTSKNVEFLQVASLSDFGRASGQPPRPTSSQQQHDMHHHHDDHDVFGGTSFFGHAGPGSSSRSYYWPSSSAAGVDPFGLFGRSSSSSNNDGNEQETQCRQM